MADRRPGPRRRRRPPLVRGTPRRHHPLLRLPDRPHRGRVGIALPPCRRRGRRGPRTRRRARRRRAGDRRPPRPPAERGAGTRIAGALQARDGPLQVPPHRRVRRGAAEDYERQDQASGAALVVAPRASQSFSLGRCGIDHLGLNRWSRSTASGSRR